MRSSGGFVLLLIGAIGLIGFLTGNLDRWLAFLFSPGGTPGPGVSTAAPAVARPGSNSPSGNQRSA